MPITEKPSPATRDAFSQLVARVGIIQARHLVSDQIRARKKPAKGYGARPGAAIKGRSRTSSRRKLSDDQLDAIKRSLDDGMTLREIAKTNWERFGYSSVDSAVQCIRTALRSRLSVDA